MLIFGGPKAYEDHWHQKLRREVYDVAPATLIYVLKVVVELTLEPGPTVDGTLPQMVQLGSGRISKE
jgi:hypothetical protein